MTLETNISNWIKLALSPITILFRNNVGTAVFPATKPGEKVRFVRYGVSPPGDGGSDNIGWTTRTITSDMVGKKVAIFTAIEVKTLEGQASKEQKNFVEQVRLCGGLAGFASTREEARTIVNRPLE